MTINTKAKDNTTTKTTLNKMISDLILKTLEPQWELHPINAAFPVTSRFNRDEPKLNAIKMDIHETDQAYEIHAEMPGVPKENAKLEIKDHVLTISYERKNEIKEDKGSFHHTERFYGKASRSIRLPNDVSEDKVEASYTDGVLKVLIGKAPVPSAKTIAIQ